MPVPLRALACAALICAGLAATASSPSLAQTVPTPTPASPTVTDTPTPTATPAAATSTPTPTPDVTATPTPAPSVTPTPVVFDSGVPCETDDPVSPFGVRRSDRRGDDEDGRDNHNEFRTGNGRNQVIVHNCTDQRLRVRASIQLNTIPGHVVAPLNEAYAEGSCVDCQTLAIALQIDLYNGERADEVRPENYAFALNTNCTRCVTVARAVQYVQPVDNPRRVPDDVAETVAELDRELRSIERDPHIGLAEAESRLNVVLERFTVLGGSLGEQRDQRDD